VLLLTQLEAICTSQFSVSKIADSVLWLKLWSNCLCYLRLYAADWVSMSYCIWRHDLSN